MESFTKSAFRKIRYDAGRNAIETADEKKSSARLDF